MIRLIPSLASSPARDRYGWAGTTSWTAVWLSERRASISDRTCGGTVSVVPSLAATTWAGFCCGTSAAAWPRTKTARPIATPIRKRPARRSGRAATASLVRVPRVARRQRRSLGARATSGGGWPGAAPIGTTEAGANGADVAPAPATNGLAVVAALVVGTPAPALAQVRAELACPGATAAGTPAATGPDVATAGTCGDG